MVLCAVMSVTVLTGCSLFVYNQGRDYNQVVAVIDPIPVYDNASGQTYTPERREIKKYELINAVNNQSSNITAETDIAKFVDDCLNSIIISQLVLNEAKAARAFNQITWGQYQENEIKKGIFSTIDNELKSIKNEILEGRGQAGTNETRVEEAAAAAGNTTYQTKEETLVGRYDHYTRAELIEEAEGRIDADNGFRDDAAGRETLKVRVREDYSNRKIVKLLENYDKQNVEKWTPSELRYPGLYGTPEAKSLEKEAMLQFLNELETMFDDDFRLTKQQKKDFLQELKNLRKTADTTGVPYAYAAMGDTAFMDYLVGENYKNSLMIQLLQESITDSVDVTDSDVQGYYDALLTEQRGKYAASSAYESDMSGGTVDPVLVFPNDNLYFVKQILIPFSDELTAELNAYKASPAYGRDGEAGLKAKKAELAKKITSYEHRDGEDYGNAKTIQDISAEITRVINGANSLYAKERAFDDLVYKYNTDPGIFGRTYGYSVKNTRGELDNDGKPVLDTQYMAEFSDAARALFESGEIGDISPWAVTDYGVHILYLSKRVSAAGEELALSAYETPAAYKTVFDKLSEKKLNERINAEFKRWEQEKTEPYLGENAEKVTRKTKVVEAYVKELKGE
ncbi:MAG: peptidyl-prolyl cis-trans isomerase [Clostridiales bacterium]|nr:peptidyl-prolyl cis-trans isomerase [Clostridiales bacterium]